jgi:hypothetical protein
MRGHLQGVAEIMFALCGCTVLWRAVARVRSIFCVALNGQVEDWRAQLGRSVVQMHGDCDLLNRRDALFDR